MNRRNFIQAIGAALGVSAGALALPHVAEQAVKAAEAEKWAYGSAIDVTLNSNASQYVTQGTAEMWNPVTQEFYTP